MVGESNLSEEEKFILNAIEEHGKTGRINYKKLQNVCGNQFEGVRLILKKMKNKGLVTFEGMIPGYSAEIKKGE
jgi:hypothetical protein